MSKGLIERLLTVEAEEPPSNAARDARSQLPDPTLHERVRLYLRAVHGTRDFRDEEYSSARNLILNEMADEIAKKTEYKEPPPGPFNLEEQSPGLSDIPIPQVLLNAMAAQIAEKTGYKLEEQRSDIADIFDASQTQAYAARKLSAPQKAPPSSMSPSMRVDTSKNRFALEEIEFPKEIEFAGRPARPSLNFSLRTIGPLSIVICVAAIVMVGAGTLALFRNHVSDSSLAGLDKFQGQEVAVDFSQKQLESGSSTPAPRLPNVPDYGTSTATLATSTGAAEPRSRATLAGAEQPVDVVAAARTGAGNTSAPADASSPPGPVPSAAPSAQPLPTSAANVALPEPPAPKPPITTTSPETTPPVSTGSASTGSATTSATPALKKPADTTHAKPSAVTSTDEQQGTQIAKLSKPAAKAGRTTVAKAEPVNAEAAVASASNAAAGSGLAGAFAQVASSQSESNARATLARLQKQFPNELRGGAVHRADLGSKGIYYRVQVGPVSREAADKICERLKANGAQCIRTGG
jgi:hypothetical protein